MYLYNDKSCYEIGKQTVYEKVVSVEKVKNCRYMVFQSPNGDGKIQFLIKNTKFLIKDTTVKVFIPYYPAFRCMHLYTKQPIFASDQVVSYTSACTKLCGCKCMHQYTKHV